MEGGTKGLLSNTLRSSPPLLQVEFALPDGRAVVSTVRDACGEGGQKERTERTEDVSCSISPHRFPLLPPAVPGRPGGRSAEALPPARGEHRRVGACESRCKGGRGEGESRGNEEGGGPVHVPRTELQLREDHARSTRFCPCRPSRSTIPSSSTPCPCGTARPCELPSERVEVEGRVGVGVGRAPLPGGRNPRMEERRAAQAEA